VCQTYISASVPHKKSPTLSIILIVKSCGWHGRNVSQCLCSLFCVLMNYFPSSCQDRSSTSYILHFPPCFWILSLPALLIFFSYCYSSVPPASSLFLHAPSSLVRLTSPWTNLRAHIPLYNHASTCHGHSSWNFWPLKVGPMGWTSVGHYTSIYCVTYEKSEDVICAAASSWNLAVFVALQQSWIVAMFSHTFPHTRKHIFGLAVITL